MKVLTVYAHPEPTSFCHAVLEEFTAGLREAGHASRVVDLHAIGFDPVFRRKDFPSYVDPSIPPDVLARMDLRHSVVASAGGPLRRALAARAVRGKTDAQIAAMVRRRMPKDVLAQQREVAWADGLAFVAPVHFLAFPAILKGWIDRVLTYGFAFRLTSAGWNGDVDGRLPLLTHARALVMTTTLFDERCYDAGIRDAMTRVMDDWSLRYPGVRRVDHVYFYAATSAPPDVRAGYLRRARDLGRTFDRPAPADAATPAAERPATTAAGGGRPA